MPLFFLRFKGFHQSFLKKLKAVDFQKGQFGQFQKIFIEFPVSRASQNWSNSIEEAMQTEMRQTNWDSLSQFERQWSHFLVEIV